MEDIDEQELLAYLRRLSPVADHALADAIARWREQSLDATVDGFGKVGLRVVEIHPAAALVPVDAAPGSGDQERA